MELSVIVPDAKMQLEYYYGYEQLYLNIIQKNDGSG